MNGKDIIKITLTLVIIYLIGGFILAGVYAKTSPIMYKNALIEKDRALKKMLPEADMIEKLGDWKIHNKNAEYFIAKKSGQPIGYIIQSFGKGYSSYINVLIAVDNNFKIIKIEILSHAETPGLGDEIETPEFKGQFVGKSIDQIKLVKVETKENIQAVTGVTISSRAVTDDAVKNALVFLTKTV
ncbi:MAG TPA: RnfABCDGE type electron transport complex subunit G, partial [Nitrospirae bacterium]|nr:RnfABCDGE type electron transport complex subunit G [Nitrospirota bacterium]